MTPETVIAGLISLINSIVPEPYAAQLVAAQRDYFAALNQQTAEEAKTAIAMENAAEVVIDILAAPTIVDSPIESGQPSAVSHQPDVSRDAQRSEPAPAKDEPKPEPPKKNGRNQAPVF